MAALLYKLDASPPACAVRMLARIIGLKLDLKQPNISKLEHKEPDFLRINPLGTIPVLVDDDLALSDSHAIMIYLLSKYGGEHREFMYPSDVDTRAIINQCLFFDTGILFIRLKVVALPTIMEGLAGPTEKHLSDIEEAYGMVEQFLSRNKYIAAGHLTIADLSVGATIAALKTILTVNSNKFPRITKWFSLLERESFFAEIMTPGAAQLGKALRLSWEKNSKDKMPLLYMKDASPPANAVRVLADMIGLQLDLKDVDLINKEHKSPAYLKLNPMGTVPTLVDDGLAVPESHTIMKYLLSKYGSRFSSTLYPMDVRTRALIDQLLFFDTGIFFIKLKLVALPSLFEGLAGPTAKHLADIDEAYGIVEAYLQNNKFIASDGLTIADISVGVTTAAMQTIHKVDPAKFPRTTVWLSRLYEEPSFRKIMVPGVEALGQVLNYCWEKNKKK